MSPLPFPFKDVRGDEMMEVQNTAHYSPNMPSRPPISILGSINSVLHAVKSGDNHNGSQTGSANGVFQNPSPGQPAPEEESDLVVLLALFIPLAVTVTAIFIIALFVRRMRRSGSAHEEHDNKNEFPMVPPRRKKASAQSTASTMSSASSTSSHRSLTPTYSTKGYTTSGSCRSQYLDSLQHSSTGSGSIYHNSSQFRHSSHLQLNTQSSLPGGLSHTPTGLPPTWPRYTDSSYGLRKLQQQLYQEATVQVSTSMQNLTGAPLTRNHSAPVESFTCTQSDPEMDVESNDESKKPSNKKIKRVLSAMNFPRKIKQYQADKKRFNVYTIPVDVREQLKHIYVY